MTRIQFRAAQRARVKKAQRDTAVALGLPKAFFQFAKRHGALPSDVLAQRLKFPL